MTALDRDGMEALASEWTSALDGCPRAKGLPRRIARAAGDVLARNMLILTTLDPDPDPATAADLAMYPSCHDARRWAHGLMGDGALRAPINETVREKTGRAMAILEKAMGHANGGAALAGLYEVRAFLAWWTNDPTARDDAGKAVELDENRATARLVLQMLSMGVHPHTRG